MSNVLDFVKERDEAIIYTWKNFDFSKLEEYMNKYCEPKACLEWEKTTLNVKKLTLCTMTLNITSDSVKPYQEKARCLYKEITGHEYKVKDND